MTRIVHCPGCKELLVEPTAGVAIYQCGNCLMVLIAKHARSSLSADQNRNAATAAAAAKASAPPPPPLYKQREQQPIAIPNPSPLPGDAAASPLYTPRNGIGSGSGRISSAAAAAAAAPAAAIDEDNSLLLQDMRKLAREAFPAPVAPQAREGSNSTSLASSNGGNGGRMTRLELDEFSFPSQARVEDLDATSDYHSTLDELDSSAQSDDLRRRSALAAAHPPRFDDRLEAPTTTASTGTGEDLCCNAATRRRRNSSSSSDALGGHEEEEDHLAMVAVNPGPVENSKNSKNKRTYPPLNSPYVVCQHCGKLLEVPRALPPPKTSVQKLRCGACHSISKFALVKHEHEHEHDSKHLEIVPVDSFDRPGGSEKRIDHNRKMDMVAMMMSSSSASPVPGSAPASYHAAQFHLQKRIANNFGKNSKGYESAPEFHHDASASTSSSHARTISAGSSSTVPLAPCLHELFGYDSPSQFFKVADNSSTKSSSETSPKPKAGGGGIKALLLKSIQDISKLHFQQQHYLAVMINGATIPDELVRKAEELAGPIHPGNYWYDYRAGFWGVMGGPCIGIIPPCIEEFKHPAMPVNCAGGKTGVVINGRELHQQDLQVLVKRGLPSTPNTAYTIDIDGVVVDLVTGNEIKCLGKLAPSIEKRGVGFGMFPLSRGLT